LHQVICQLDAVGEERTFEVAPYDAFGERSADLGPVDFPSTAAPEGLQVGMTVQLSNGLKARVMSMTDETMTIDANPTLAGESLSITVKLLERPVCAIPGTIQQPRSPCPKFAFATQAYTHPGLPCGVWRSEGMHCTCDPLSAPDPSPRSEQPEQKRNCDSAACPPFLRPFPPPTPARIPASPLSDSADRPLAPPHYPYPTPTDRRRLFRSVSCHLRGRVLLGPRARVPAGAGRGRHQSWLYTGRHQRTHLRARLRRQHRPHRGRAGGIRPKAGAQLASARSKCREEFGLASADHACPSKDGGGRGATLSAEPLP
jgi:hypothetical protein